ncbi:Crp/Fnr family transcriptional regulator [Bacteroides sp.]
MTNVIDKISSLYPISDETLQALKEKVTLCHFPKKYQLVEANKFCKSAYFIEKGMTRSFWLVNGEEITTSFSCEGGIVFSMDELYYNKMSEEFVETLEDVVAYKISLTDLLYLFHTNIELANWGRVIHQDEYRRLHRSHKDRLTLSAKERYEEFKQQFPEICQRVQLGYIASYLGITLSTLSRLRAHK